MKSSCLIAVVVVAVVVGGGGGGGGGGEAPGEFLVAPITVLITFICK